MLSHLNRTTGNFTFGKSFYALCNMPFDLNVIYSHYTIAVIRYR